MSDVVVNFDLKAALEDSFKKGLAAGVATALEFRVNFSRIENKFNTYQDKSFDVTSRYVHVHGGIDNTNLIAEVNAAITGIPRTTYSGATNNNFVEFKSVASNFVKTLEHARSSFTKCKTLCFAAETALKIADKTKDATVFQSVLDTTTATNSAFVDAYIINDNAVSAHEKMTVNFSNLIHKLAALYPALAKLKMIFRVEQNKN